MAWVWGSNEKGELGLGDYTNRTAPFPLVSLKEKGINCIEVGHQFSIGYVKPKQDVRAPNERQPVLKPNTSNCSINISKVVKVRQRSITQISDEG